MKSYSTFLLFTFLGFGSFGAAQSTLVAEGVDYETMLNVANGTSRFDSSERFYDAGKGWYWVQKNAGGHDGVLRYLDYKGSFDFLEELYPYIPEDYRNRQYTSNGTYDYNAMKNLTGDSNMCWAYSAANGVQYWQSYYGVFYKGNDKLSYGYTYSDIAPWGGDDDKRYWLGGTQSTEVSMALYNAFENNGGESYHALSWYLKGNSTTNLKSEYEGKGGFFSSYFEGQSSYLFKSFSSGDSYQSLTEHFAAGLGYSKNELGQYERTIKGVIAQLGIVTAENIGHSITLYGMELDANNNVCALYLADSDDFSLKLRKTNLVYETLNGRTAYYLVDGEFSEDGAYSYITDLTWINTPETLKTMLKEYETNDLTWNGTATVWKDTSALATTEELPTEATGWAVYAVDGYYSSYYGANRGVSFNDEADNTVVTLGENVSVPSMSVNNSEKAYDFIGNGYSIMTGTLTKSGTNDAVFDGVSLIVKEQAKVTGAGKMVLTGGTVMTVGNNVVYSLSGNNADAFLSNVILTDGVISGESVASPGMLGNVALTLTAGQEFSMSNVVVDAKSVINGGVGASLYVNKVTIMLSAENTFMPEDATLFSMDMGNLSLENFTLNSTVLEGLTLMGDGLLFDMSGLGVDLLTDMKEADYVSLSLGENVNLNEVTNLHITLDGVNNIVASADLNTLTFMVPEPSSAMLCLLSIGGLACRRRRSA